MFVVVDHHLEYRRAFNLFCYGLDVKSLHILGVFCIDLNAEFNNIPLHQILKIVLHHDVVNISKVT